MKTQFLALLVVGILAIAGGAALGVSPGTIQLAEDPTLLGDGSDFPGMWEYVYDVHGETAPVDRVGLSGFDASETVNQWPWSGWNRTGTLVQKWDWRIGHNAYHEERAGYGSYAINGVEPWILHDEPWSIDNSWHTPNEYAAVGTTYPFPQFTFAGEVADDDQSLTFTSRFQDRVVSGLLLTFRIVHPYTPGNINWSLLSLRREGQSSGTVVGPKFVPPEPPLGDFDDSMHVDNVDIDMLCDAIYAGLSEPEDLALYDISGDGLTEGTDGVIDTKDLDYLVRFLVEISTSLDPGTEYGDFNLDGVIDTTDLTRLATNYGSDDWKWDDGNANRYIDTDIDNTDLTILATYFGFGEPDVVPEPASAGLLLLGALAVLRRRRKAKR